MMLATTAEAESKLSQELTPKIAAANDFVKKCKELLSTMRDETKEKSEAQLVSNCLDITWDNSFSIKLSPFLRLVYNTEVLNYCEATR